MNRTRFIAYTGILTAIVTVTTFAAIHTPNTQGFINFGDAIIFIAGIFFGPFAGLIAGGLGSAFADMILGYTVTWAPFTLVIKGAEGFIVGLVSAILCKMLAKKYHVIAYLLAMTAAGLIMVAGYFFATWILYGFLYGGAFHSPKLHTNGSFNGDSFAFNPRNQNNFARNKSQRRPSINALD